MSTRKYKNEYDVSISVLLQDSTNKIADTRYKTSISYFYFIQFPET